MRARVVLAGVAIAAAAPCAVSHAACRPGTVADLGGIADARVRRAIQAATGAIKTSEAGESTGDVTCDAILALRALDIHTAVTSLRGVGLLAHLERLSVGERLDYYTPSRDPQPLTAAALAGLAELPALRALSLGPVADLAPVAGLPALEELNVDRAVSPDLTAVGTLHHLRVLQIGAGDPRVWSSNPNVPPDRTVGLVYALARGGAVADLRPLAGLTSLEVIEIPGARIVDVAPLAGLHALHVLDLRKNAIVDVAPLAGLTKLELLIIDQNQIADVTSLARLRALQAARLGDNPITDAAPLSGLTALRELYLDRTKVADARPLAGLTGLKLLYMCDSPANKDGRGTAARANQAVFRTLRKRGASVPNQRGCHCC